MATPTLDIVELIEKNPVTKLTNTYENRLLIKIKENFTENHQQLFVASFYCYLHYNQTNDFVIDLSNVWTWIGFSNKQNAKKALIKYFILEKDYKISLIQMDYQDKKHGGNNKETILMNVNTFKKFCLKSNTKKADEIHDYFIKLEELLKQTIYEDSVGMREQMKQTEQKYNHKLVKDREIQKQELLLREYGSGQSLIYIVRVKTFEDGCYVVKIGESRKGVENRFKEHKKQYKENELITDAPENIIQNVFTEQKINYDEDIVLLDVFPVLKSHDFENFIHNHPKIRPSLYKELQNHEKETELFLVGRELSYATIIQIINSNIKRYNEYSETDFKLLQETIEKQNLKIELLEYKLLQKESNGNFIINDSCNQILQKLDKLDIIKIQLQQFTENTQQPKIIPDDSQKRLKTGFGNLNKNIGPRLQKINPETLQILKVYEYVEEAITESNCRLKRPSIEKAVVEGTIYQGFRYNYVPREKDPTIIHDLLPTKKTKIQTTGYVAKLNETKTEILNVYLDKKTACFENGYNSSAGIDFSVKNKTITRNHFYALFRDCDPQLQTDFIEKYCDGDIERLLLYKDGMGKYDEKGVLICEYACKYDCITTQKIADKTLTKCIENNTLYNGVYYRKIGSKLKII
jgi:hypothetical protein